MKASQINLPIEGFNMSAKYLNGHYKFIMSLGRCVPQTRAQAKHYYSLFKDGRFMDVLNMDDVIKLEAIMNKHGYFGEYKYTKSKTWVRILNTSELAMAYKKEYNG